MSHFSSWLQSYSKNVPAEIEASHLTLQDIILNAGAEFEARPAYTCMGHTLSFGEILAQAKAFANFCREILNLKQGDCLALMMPNLLQYPICLFGGLLAGLTIINLNPLDKADSLKNELKDSGAKAIVVLENSVAELVKALPETVLMHVIITSVGAMQPVWKRWLINGYMRHIKRVVPKWPLPGALRLSDALKAGDTFEFEKVPVRSEDLAFIQYTGGTTGVAKGVMLSHHNLCANIIEVHAWVKDVLDGKTDIVLTALPLYHIFSLVINCFLFMYVGGQNVLIPDPRDIPHLVREMQKSRFTCFCGVNTIFNALLHNQEFRNLDHSRFKLIIGGGMAVQKTVADEWQRITKSIIIQGYGLTETSPVVTINPLTASTFTGSIGLPISSTLVSIRDPHNQELPIGATGELCVKGPQVMQGYLHQAAETAHVMTDGWLHTGDVAYMDEKGFVYIVDRLKDMVIVSGFNVYPTEIENFLKTIPGINEVAVIGIPDATHGEGVKAFIVKENGSDLTAEKIIEICHDKLVAYKCPRQVEFLAALPKSAVGKILKKELRKREEMPSISSSLSL